MKMKNNLQLSLVLISFLISHVIKSAAQDTATVDKMYVCLQGGEVKTFDIDNIDSIVFRDPARGYVSGDTVTVTAFEMRALTETLVHDVILASYDSLKRNAGRLAAACDTLYRHTKDTTLTQAHIDAACEAYKATHDEWARTLAFLYGTATDYAIDARLDSWPLNKDEIAFFFKNSTFVNGIKGDNPVKFVYDNHGNFDTVFGFHGLEFMLFRNGANRTVADFSGKDTYYEGLNADDLDEAAFTAAVAANIRNLTTFLYYSWSASVVDCFWLGTNAQWVLSSFTHAWGYSGLSPKENGFGEYLISTTTDKGWCNTWQETMADIILLGGCSNICHELYTQMLGQAYSVATDQGPLEGGMDYESIDYMESPFSKRTFIDCLNDVRSIRNVLYGTRDFSAAGPAANSLMKVMEKYGYVDLPELKTTLAGAISALESARDSGIAFVDNPGHTQVKSCIDATHALDDQLNAAAKWFKEIRVVP